MKKSLTLILLCLSLFFVSASNEEKQPNNPPKPVPQQGVLIAKDIVTGPEAPAQVSALLLTYGNGFLQFAIPDDYEYLSVRLFNNSEEYTGTVTHSDPVMEIPELEGRYAITCTADNGRVFTGTIEFE